MQLLRETKYLSIQQKVSRRHWTRKIEGKYFKRTFNPPIKKDVWWFQNLEFFFQLNIFNFNTCIEKELKRRNNYKSIFEREMCILESNIIVIRGTDYTESCNVYLLQVNVCTTPLINLSKIYIKLLSSANNWPISKAKWDRVRVPVLRVLDHNHGWFKRLSCMVIPATS